MRESQWNNDDNERKLNWNIVESGIKHHNPNPSPLPIKFSKKWIWYLHFYCEKGATCKKEQGDFNFSFNLREEGEGDFSR
jgi:hypothetical protein